MTTYWTATGSKVHTKWDKDDLKSKCGRPVICEAFRSEAAYVGVCRKCEPDL